VERVPAEFGFVTTTTPTPPRFLDEQKSLACIHCGLCLGACPTYLETGNENDSPRGRIYLMRAVQDGRLPLDHVAVRHLDLCLGCRACEAACPSGVQYGALLEGTRDHIEAHYGRSAFQTFLRRVAIERVFPFPGRMKLALLPARWLRAAGADRFLPKLARDAVGLLPEKLSCRSLAEFSPATTEPKRGRIGFIRGCVASVLFGDTNAASIALLNRAGYDVFAPAAPGCCGALYAHSGNLARARDCARRNLAAFDAQPLDAIITNAAGCGSTLKAYDHLLADDAEWIERAQRFSAKVEDLSERLARPESLNRLFPASRLTPHAAAGADHAVRITFHDACHLAHAQRITKAPRDLLRAVAGQNFVELAESDVCCGSAGSYNLTEPEMAERLQRRKIDYILASGAQIVVTTNPGCILQIQAGLRNAGAAHVRVRHLADFLFEAVGVSGRNTTFRVLEGIQTDVR
jgi:glycolate oxidase iron-sulfur subunit